MRALFEFIMRDWMWTNWELGQQVLPVIVSRGASLRLEFLRQLLEIRVHRTGTITNPGAVP